MASGVATQENGALRAAAQAVTLAEFLLGPDGVAKSGAELVWIDVLTEDGVRFADGFGGLGGYLHWPFESFEDEEEEEEEKEEEEEEEECGYEAGAGAGAGAGSEPSTKFSPPCYVPPPPGLGIGIATLRADAPTWSPQAAAGTNRAV